MLSSSDGDRTPSGGIGVSGLSGEDSPAERPQGPDSPQRAQHARGPVWSQPALCPLSPSLLSPPPALCPSHSNFSHPLSSLRPLHPLARSFRTPPCRGEECHCHTIVSAALPAVRCTRCPGVARCATTCPGRLEDLRHPAIQTLKRCVEEIRQRAMKRLRTINSLRLRHESRVGFVDAGCGLQRRQQEGVYRWLRPSRHSFHVIADGEQDGRQIGRVQAEEAQLGRLAQRRLRGEGGSLRIATRGHAVCRCGGAHDFGDVVAGDDIEVNPEPHVQQHQRVDRPHCPREAKHFELAPRGAVVEFRSLGPHPPAHRLRVKLGMELRAERAQLTLEHRLALALRHLVVLAQPLIVVPPAAVPALAGCRTRTEQRLEKQLLEAPPALPQPVGAVCARGHHRHAGHGALVPPKPASKPHAAARQHLPQRSYFWHMALSSLPSPVPSRLSSARRPSGLVPLGRV
eukprot:scaffold5360_cov118-Isochrysis_galbana.AAC.4